MKSSLDAELEFDIVAHLGYVKNIDLAQKGVYSIQMSLYYGNNFDKPGSRNNKSQDKAVKIAPIGLFSSPTSLDSYVASQKVKLKLIML